jgi:abortive infection protein
MLKDNYSIKETKISQKNRNAVVLVVLLIVLSSVPSFLLTFILQVQIGDRIYPNPKLLSNYLSGDTLLLANLYSTILTSVLIYLLAKYYLKRNTASLGLKNPNKSKNYLKGASIGLLMITVDFLLLKAFGLATISYNFKNIKPLIFIAFLIGWIFQGFEEELLCRSILMNYFASLNGVASAIITNSLIFSILHINNPGFGVLAFVNIFLLGSIFSLLFYIADDIFLPAAAHSFWNFAQGNIYGINVSGLSQSETTLVKTKIAGNPFLTGGLFGIEGGLITFIVELTVVLILIRKIKKNKNYILKENINDSSSLEKNILK